MKTKFVFLSIIVLFTFGACKKAENVEFLGKWGFSPNGDGLNDLFILAQNDGLNMKKMDILFDTTKINWMTIIETGTNKVVYKVSQYHHNWWNGQKNNNGSLVPIGVYDFYLELENEKTYLGNVYVKY